MVAWSKCCIPKDQGGLGLKNLQLLNKALLLKRSWEVASKATISAAFLHVRFLTAGLQPFAHYKKSSVWLGIKKLWPVLLSNVRWLVGKGDAVRFWKDNWLGVPIVASCNIDESSLDFLNDKVAAFISNGVWNLPASFQRTYPNVTHSILSTVLPMDNVTDQIIWAASTSGFLNSKEAYKFFSPSFPLVHWCHCIWHAAIQPRKSLAVWKILKNRVPSDDRLQRFNVALCSRCYLCLSNCETSKHLFLDCPLAVALWVWIFSLFRVAIPHGALLQDLFLEANLTSLNHSSRLFWFIAVSNLLWCLWSERNKRRHEGGVCCALKLKQFFVLSLRDSATLVFPSTSSSISSLPIFNLLGLSPLRLAAPRFIPVLWQPPPPLWVKVNIDGSFHGRNNAGFWGVFRDSSATFLGAFSCLVEASSAIETELLAVIEAINVAWAKGWLKLWLETDSTLVLHYFHSPNLVPWRFKIPWANCISITKQLSFYVSHIFREGNTVADTLANYGAFHFGSHWWDALPPFLAHSYGHDRSSQVPYRSSCFWSSITGLCDG